MSLPMGVRKLFRRRLEFKQGNKAIYLMWGSLHQWLLHVCRQSGSETDFTEFLQEWASQSHQSCMRQFFHQSLCSVCIGWPVGTHCLHRLKLSETIGLQTGIREGTSPFWKTAVDTRQDCRWELSIAPGTCSMQHSWHRYKNVGQAQVVLLFFLWMWIGLESTLLLALQGLVQTSFWCRMTSLWIPSSWNRSPKQSWEWASTWESLGVLSQQDLLELWLNNVTLWQKSPSTMHGGCLHLCFFGICVVALFSKLALRTWRWLEQRMISLETAARGIGSDLEQSRMQLADHYDFAAELSSRIDDFSGRTSTVEENHDILAALQAVFEQEMLEGYSAMEQSTNCVRYGLMELGGFVRHASLTSDQLRHMMMQERGNLVINLECEKPHREHRPNWGDSKWFRTGRRRSPNFRCRSRWKWWTIWFGEAVAAHAQWPEQHCIGSWKWEWVQRDSACNSLGFGCNSWTRAWRYEHACDQWNQKCLSETSQISPQSRPRWTPSSIQAVCWKHGKLDEMNSENILLEMQQQRRVLEMRFQMKEQQRLQNKPCSVSQRGSAESCSAYSCATICTRMTRTDQDESCRCHFHIYTCHE